MHKKPSTHLDESRLGDLEGAIHALMRSKCGMGRKRLTEELCRALCSQESVRPVTIKDAVEIWLGEGDVLLLGAVAERGEPRSSTQGAPLHAPRTRPLLLHARKPTNCKTVLTCFYNSEHLSVQGSINGAGAERGRQ